MRAFFVTLTLVVGVMGCGPSNAQIRTAKTAQYKAPARSVLDVAVQVAQDAYKVRDIDIENVSFVTEPQWYSPEGGRISATNEGGGDFVNAGGGDVQVWFVVRVRETAPDRVMVEITPKTMQLVGGSPQPRELKPDDPNLPPWVLGRVDSLAVAIYEQARKLY